MRNNRRYVKKKVKKHERFINFRVYRTLNILTVLMVHFCTQSNKVSLFCVLHLLCRKEIAHRIGIHC